MVLTSSYPACAPERARRQVQRSCPIRDLGPDGRPTFGRTPGPAGRAPSTQRRTPTASTRESTMCTVLITYSTPPPPTDTTGSVHGETDEGPSRHAGDAVGPATVGRRGTALLRRLDGRHRRGHRRCHRRRARPVPVTGWRAARASRSPRRTASTSSSPSTHLRVSHSPRGTSRSARPAEPGRPRPSRRTRPRTTATRRSR